MAKGILTRAAIAALGGLFVSGASADSELPTIDQALKDHFGTGKIESQVIHLTESDLDQLVPQLGFGVSEREITFFLARSGEVAKVSDRSKASDTIKGYAGLLTRKVRSKDQTALYFVSNQGKLESIELIRFLESSEYAPSKDWLKQFSGLTPQKKPLLHQDIKVVSGATYTARSLLEGTRLILAVWQRQFGPHNEAGKKPKKG